MDVVVGNSRIRLEQTDFVAAGGEGSVYVKGGTAYKIYTDPSKMIPTSKVGELSALTDPKIIKPEQIIFDKKNSPIGYTMKALDKTEALCRIFTKAFRQRNNIEHDDVLKLVQQFQQTIRHIHSKDILVVDLNELNFLIDDSFENIYCIDVDSYQTKSFPATALMESVRDRHAKTNKFTKETDWFSWAIVTFQMFIGIHPYKGRHPLYNDLDSRMKQNISVFNKDVSIPKVCYPFDVIPSAYRDWYKAVFEGGKRCEPPTDIDVAVAIVSVAAHRVAGSNNFVFDEIESISEDIVGAHVVNGRLVIITPKRLRYRNNEFSRANVPVKILETKRDHRPIAAALFKGELTLTDLDSGIAVVKLPAEDFTICDGRFVLRMGGSITELTLLETAHNKLMPLQQIVANVLPKATKTFDGCLVQNLLDACYVSVFPAKGGHYQIRIKEVEKYTRIIDAKYANHVLMMIVEAAGEYHRFIIRFDDNFREYDIQEQADALPTLNFVVLDNGLAVHIEKDEKLVLFRNKKGDSRTTVVEDPSISTDMTLYRDGAKALVAKGGKLFRLSMK